MGMTLADALKQVDLEPGRLYRERVNGKTVVLRVIADPVPAEEQEASEPDGPPYLLPWFELPWGPGVEVIAQPGPISWPDPPIVPPDYEAEE